MLRRMATTAKTLSVEAYIWLAALLALALTDPTTPPLIELCPLNALGASFCPGCGLGRAIAHLFRGEWLASWMMHPLALPVVAVLVARIGRLAHEAYQRSLQCSPSPHQHA